MKGNDERTEGLVWEVKEDLEQSRMGGGKRAA